MGVGLELPLLPSYSQGREETVSCPQDRQEVLGLIGSLRSLILKGIKKNPSKGWITANVGLCALKNE